jgi:general secretion pathway protein F
VPFFAYKATDEQGRIVDGQIEAKTREAVVERLQRLAFFPLEIKDAEVGAETGAGGGAVSFRWQRTKRVAFFTGQLATLLEAGLPVDRSLRIAEELTEDKTFTKVVQEVRISVEEGSTLADALSKQKAYFDDLYVNMVRAGESGGVLEIVFRRLGDYLEESQRVKDFVMSSLAYPIFLVLFSAGALILIFVSVLPRFARIFTDMGQAIPGPAKLLLGVSNFVGATWWMFLGGFAAFFLFFRSWVATPAGRLWWDQTRLGWPLIGTILKKLETARFARTLGTLMASGVPILQAVDIVGQTIGNRYMASFMGDIKSGLKKGEGLVGPLRKAGVFPTLFIHMTTVGEETGRLEEMLMKTASIFEREMESATKALLSLLEPVILLTLGIVLGSIILTILMAIFSVYKLSF